MKTEIRQYKPTHSACLAVIEKSPGNNEKCRFSAVDEGLTTGIASNTLFLLYYEAPPHEMHRIHTAMSKTATLTRNRNGNGRSGNGHGRNGNGRAATAAVSAAPVVKNYITPQGYARLKTELTKLLDAERPELVKTIQWAASNGDRSENGDYLYGKKRLREIDRRIHYLNKRLDSAEVVDPVRRGDSDQIFFGATVTYAYVRGGRGERIITNVGGGGGGAKNRPARRRAACIAGAAACRG